MTRRPLGLLFLCAAVAVPALGHAQPKAPEAFYKSLELVPGKLVGTSPFRVGDVVKFDFGLKNVSKADLTVPRPAGASPGGDDVPAIGVEQYWVERLGANPVIPTIPPTTARQGRKYAAGGAVLNGKEIKAGAVLPLRFASRVDTTGFPPGQYRFSVEFKTRDTTQVLQTKFVDFELK